MKLLPCRRITGSLLLALGLTAAATVCAGDASAMIAAEDQAMEGGGGGGGGGGYYYTPPADPYGFEVFDVDAGSSRRAPGSLITVYLHGRNFHNGEDGGAAYWSKGSNTGGSRGPYPTVLRWQGADALSQSTDKTARNLDALCKGGNPCQVVCHSTGCLLIGRMIAENPGRWNITQTYALAGAQGGTPGAAYMIALSNGGALSLGAKIGAHFGPIGAIVGAIIGETIWQTIGVHFVGPTSGVVYDLVPARARSMYNHDISVSTVTVSGARTLPLKKCAWYNPFCHIANAGRGLVNTFMSAFFLGGTDGVIPVQSSASHRYVVPGWQPVCSPVGTWSNHWSRQGCSKGLNNSHLDVQQQIGAADIYMPPVSYPQYDDCADGETEGTCNSYDDYLDRPVTDGSGPINGRCGGYELSTQNAMYGTECSSLRYYGTTGDAVVTTTYVSGGGSGGGLQQVSEAY